MLKINNTLTKQLEEFKPIEPNKVKFYQCGPTVYSHQHIGNLFSPLKGDLIRRALIYLGYNVKYVKNITDVGHLVGDEDDGEDKMTKGAKKENLSPNEIAKKFTDIYHKDLNKLNVLKPDVETIATEYVKQMAEMVQTLIDEGYAYATELAIYFDVDKFPSYNELNRQKLDENLIGAGHGQVGDPNKRNHYDFSIWFFKTGKHKNALQTWEFEFKDIKQPTKEGFPGWHIECSAMSKAELGDTIDIHMGGIEHIPVHHTNEIAQSEAANGKKFVNYWLHHEWLLIDGGKMSKSLGNIYTLDNIIERGIEPLAFRYFLLNAHYRSKQNFTWEALEACANAYERLKNRITEIGNKIGDCTNLPIDKEWQEKFIKAIENDFNIPEAVGFMWDVLKSNLKDSLKVGTVLNFDKVFGLNLKEHANCEIKIDPELQKMLEKRAEARKNKHWVKSDELRDKIEKDFGVKVKDTEEGQKVI